MVVVAAHTPCRGGGGGAWTISLRRGPTPKRVPHRVPNPARRAFRHVSHFTSPLHGVPNPTIRSFRVVSCFTGCLIPELWLCQQQVHRLSRYGCVLFCVSRQRAEPLGACTSPPPPPKNSLADRPIYHFHFNIHFLKAPLTLCWSQAPRHSVTPYTPAYAPHVIIYFRCLLESLLDLRSSACCRSVVRSRGWKNTQGKVIGGSVLRHKPCPTPHLTKFQLPLANR